MFFVADDGEPSIGNAPEHCGRRAANLDGSDPPVFDLGLSFTAIAETGLSEINSETGELRIQGFSVEDLAEKAAYEEAAWLVLNGRLPTDEELAEFRRATHLPPTSLGRRPRPDPGGSEKGDASD